jgi:nucleotidyltransferase/DNA polymerase involved in DNA repair
MTGQMAREYGSRHAAEVTRVVKGAGEPQAVTYPRQGREEEKPKAKARLSREIIRKGKQEEGFDLYDLVLAHLIDEGYAETQEAATAIMANMSEGWVDAIVDSYIQD